MKILTVILALVFAIAVAAPVAQAGKDYAEPAKMTHWVTGTVASVDPGAKSLTLTADKPRQGTSEYTFTVADDKQLANVKAGDHVQVGYATNRNKQMVAQEIVPKRTAARR